MKIGIVGVGIMGNGIAANYLKNDCEVFIWNRTKEKLGPLLKEGAVVLDTPREVAKSADVVFEVTANDESSKEVWLGENGILKGARIDSTLITCATLSIEWIDELAKKCQDEEYTFFDMPMTGGRIGAEAGNLVLLIGGDEEKLRGLEKNLEAVSKERIYFGPAGSGMRYKLLLNMLQAIHIVGLGEVLKVANQAKMDIEKVGNALAQRPGGTTTNLAWRDYQKAPNPINFSIEWLAKDLRYAKQFAKELSLPLLDDAITRYENAMEKGMAQDDWTAVNKMT